MCRLTQPRRTPWRSGFCWEACDQDALRGVFFTRLVLTGDRIVQQNVEELDRFLHSAACAAGDSDRTPATR